MEKSRPQAPEFWDIWNMDGSHAGVLERGKGYIPPHQYHITVEIIPTDGKGYLLLTKRSMSKAKGGGLYEFPAGSVKAGENPIDAASRELEEEVGLEIDSYGIYPLTERIVPGLKRIIYLAIIPDLKQLPITLCEEEAESYRFVTVSEWYEIIGRGEFEISRLQMYNQTVYELIEEATGLPPTSLPAMKKKPLRQINPYLITPSAINSTDAEEEE